MGTTEAVISPAPEFVQLVQTQAYTSQLADLYRAREAQELNVPAYALVELPESEAASVTTRIREAERSASPSLAELGYDYGSATYPDELLVVTGFNRVLLTGEHSTTHYTLKGTAANRKAKEADFGTAGLGIVVTKDTGEAFVMPRGRQEGNANNDIQHPLKDIMRDLLLCPQNKGHLSLHALNSGRAATPWDERSYNVVIGVGDNPSPQTSLAAEKIQAFGRELGLHVGINSPHVSVEANGVPRRNGLALRRVTFAAKGAGTTRTWAQQVAKNEKIPRVTMQLEISGSLRLLPPEREVRKSEKEIQMGVYMGYIFLQQCVEILRTAA